MSENDSAYRRNVKFSPASMKSKGDLVPLNAKLRDGAYVTAQRAAVQGGMKSDIIGLIASDEKLYYMIIGGMIRDVETGNGYLLQYHAEGILSYVSPAGKHVEYAYGAGGVHKIEEGVFSALKGVGGASAAAIYHERLFLANGSEITYSVPLDVENLDPDADMGGRISLSTVGGDILALIPQSDKILVFRTHEILKLQANANDLNFSFSKIDFDGGEIVQRSVRSCGRKVVFRTERGLFVLEGDTCKEARGICDGLEFCSPVLSASHAGIYYSTVLHEGEKYLFAYDPEQEEYYLFGASPTMLTGSVKGLYFNHGLSLIKIEEGGQSPYSYAQIDWKADLSEYAGKYVLEGVTVLGKGDDYTFTFSQGGEERKSCILTLPATVGFRHTLPPTDMRAVLRSAYDEFECRGIVFHLRRIGT